MSAPFTHYIAGVDRRWKVCKCGECGVVRQCVPEFDFYGKKFGELLLCERCFRSDLSDAGVKFWDATPKAQA